MSRDPQGLSAGDRRRRARRLAREALGRYGIEATRLVLVRDTWNTMFRVDAADGSRYALRVSRPGFRQLIDILSELAWLAALGHETDLLVPEPVPARDGSLVVTVDGADIPQHVALFRWVGGRHTRRSPSQRTIALLGETMARLHEHADHFSPSTEFMRERFDRACSLAAISYIRSDRPHPMLPPERRALFRRAMEPVQAEIDRVYSGPESPRFLHLDMHLGNVRLLNGKLGILDFDDSMWAFPIQDIGISLFYLRRYGQRFSVLSAFRTGYERVRPWPEEWEGQVFIHVQARALDLADVLLELDAPGMQAALPRLLDDIESVLRPGARLVAPALTPE